MAATNERIITVFGGTGFLGRRIVRHLHRCGFAIRIASRHPDRAERLFALDDPKLQSVEANIHDEGSVAEAVAGAYAVINAVSLYIEQGRETFHAVHVESAQRLAAQARKAEVKRFAHVSGIGADATSPSLYIRKRGEGELAVRAAFADSTLVRPAVRAGRRVSPPHRQAPQPASKLPDVRPRPHEITASLCGRCGGSDCEGAATDKYTCSHIRVRRPPRLLLRGIGKHPWAL